MKRILFIFLVMAQHAIGQQYYQAAGTNVLTDSYIHDTILKPDYYQVDITICERWACIPEGKRRCNYTKITLDSLEKRLRHEMALNHIPFSRIAVIEMKSTESRRYSSDKPLFRKTFRLKIMSQDTVLSLFEKYKDDLFYGFIASPVIDYHTIEKITASLRDSIHKKMEGRLAVMAASKGVALTTPYMQSCSMQKKVLTDGLYYNYQQAPDYRIDLQELTYSIYASIGYYTK